MAKRNNPALVILKGAAAGLVSTAVISLAVSQAPRLLHLTDEKADVPADALDQGDKTPKLEKAAERLTESVMHKTLHKPMNDQTRKVADNVAFWGYGALLGALYGVGQTYSRMPGMLFGTVFGGATRFVDSIVMSDMNIWPSRMKSKIPMGLMNTGMRFAFGWLTSFTYNMLSRFI